MAAIDDIVRPDAELKSTTTLQKLLDIWWRICSKSGLTRLVAAFAEGILNASVVKYDQFGKIVGKTSPGNEFSWLPGNIQRLSAGQAELKEMLAQVIKAQGITLDEAAVEAAAERGATKAITDNVVKVDVSVHGSTADQGQEQSNG